MIRQTQNHLQIRLLRREDIPAIVEGERAQGWHPTEEKYLARLRDMAAGRCVTLAAVLDGQAVGYLSVYWQDDGPELVDLGVLERCRNRGIGTRLMDAAEALAFEESDVAFIGVGLHSGYGSAQRMYARRGYVPDGQGAYYGEAVCTPYASYPLDDSLILRMSRRRAPAREPFLVRRATPDDLERLWRYNIEANPGDPRWGEWRKVYLAYNAGGLAETYAVLIGGEPVGEGTLLLSPACGAIAGRACLADGRTVANVNALRIRAPFEGFGYVSALVRRMEERAGQLGLRALTIGVEAANTRALAIYLHWGYRTLVHAEEEEDGTVLYYEKSLEQTAAPLDREETPWKRSD